MQKNPDSTRFLLAPRCCILHAGATFSSVGPRREGGAFHKVRVCRFSVEMSGLCEGGGVSRRPGFTASLNRHYVLIKHVGLQNKLHRLRRDRLLKPRSRRHKESLGGDRHLQRGSLKRGKKNKTNQEIKDPSSKFVHKRVAPGEDGITDCRRLIWASNLLPPGLSH